MRPESYSAGERAALIGCGALIGFLLGGGQGYFIATLTRVPKSLSDQIDKVAYFGLGGGLMGAVAIALAAASLTRKRFANRNAKPPQSGRG